MNPYKKTGPRRSNMPEDHLEVAIDDLHRINKMFNQDSAVVREMIQVIEDMLAPKLILRPNPWQALLARRKR